MGLDVFLFNPRLQPEEPNDYWDWEVVTEILARDAKDPDYLYFFEYPDGGGAGEVFGLVERRDQGLMFAHFGGRTFMARMFEIAHRTRSLIYWTGGAARPPYGVTHEDLVEAVPDEFTKGERPHLIRDLDHMAELIGRHKLTPMTYIQCG
jgi:hypothetical protein